MRQNDPISKDVHLQLLCTCLSAKLITQNFLNFDSHENEILSLVYFENVLPDLSGRGVKIYKYSESKII